MRSISRYGSPLPSSSTSRMSTQARDRRECNEGTDVRNLLFLARSSHSLPFGQQTVAGMYFQLGIPPCPVCGYLHGDVKVKSCVGTTVISTDEGNGVWVAKTVVPTWPEPLTV